MANNTKKEDKSKPNQIAFFLEGKNEVPLDKKGYNDAPAAKIERPKPSPTPPPTKQD